MSNDLQCPNCGEQMDVANSGLVVLAKALEENKRLLDACKLAYDALRDHWEHVREDADEVCLSCEALRLLRAAIDKAEGKGKA